MKAEDEDELEEQRDDEEAEERRRGGWVSLGLLLDDDGPVEPWERTAGPKPRSRGRA